MLHARLETRLALQHDSAARRTRRRFLAVSWVFRGRVRHGDRVTIDLNLLYWGPAIRSDYDIGDRKEPSIRRRFSARSDTGKLKMAFSVHATGSP